MKQHIMDKAEVSVDFPEKTYYGAFGRHSSFELKADEHGVHIDLQRDSGEKRHVGFHIHYHLLADIIGATARELDDHGSLDQMQREALEDSVQALSASLQKTKGKD